MYEWKDWLKKITGGRKEVEAAFTDRAATLQPEARVKAFIADFHRAHGLHKSEKRDGDEFLRWHEWVDTLDRIHFLDDGGMELGQVIHGESPHTLEDEPIVSTQRRGDRVVVETCTDRAGLPDFYEYELREVGTGDWRIVRLRCFLDDATAPFVDEEAQPDFTDPPVHPLRQLPAGEAHVDGDELFADGHLLDPDDDASTIEVRAVGELNVTTGTLVVGDLGYGTETLLPVGQRVPPGRYPAEVAIAFHRNAALRVRFADRPVVRWHPADLGEGGHVFGVDAGNAAIMDVAALLTLNARDKERAFDAYTRAKQRPRSQMLSLIAENDTVVADSGRGDGSYPVYWGVDADARPVVLLVHFMLVWPEGSQEKSSQRSDCATSSNWPITALQPSKKPMSSCLRRSSSLRWRQRAV